MKIKLSLLVAFIALAGGFFSSAVVSSGANLTIYPVAPIYPQTTAPYTLRADGVNVPIVSYVDEYDYAQFSLAGGPVTLEITVPSQTGIVSSSISPKKLGLTGTVAENRLTFQLANPEYLIVQINGLKRLVIAVDAPENEVPPAAGSGIFNITKEDYAADRSGRALATTAIQRAIDDASAYGLAHGRRGLVHMPAGVYRSGNLQLKSNVELYLAPGAVLRASDNPQDFTPHYYKTSQRRYVTWFIATQPGADNITIRGRGTIDANGLHLGEAMGLGTNFLVPLGCSHFSVDGITFRDSAAWGIVTARSCDLSFTNLKIFNRLSQAGENDSIDICESQNVAVTNVIGISLDDPFSTKTWGVNTGLSQRWPGEPQANRQIVFDRCLSWTECYAFKVGQGTKLLQEDITFKNSVAYDCAVGIGIDHKYGTAPVRNVLFENIDVERVSAANEGHATWAAFFIQNAHRDGAGPILGLTVRDVTVWDRGPSGGFLAGISAHARIEGVTFDRIHLPGLVAPAANLHELDMTHTGYVSGLTILPLQTPEPAW